MLSWIKWNIYANLRRNRAWYVDADFLLNVFDTNKWAHTM